MNYPDVPPRPVLTGKGLPLPKPLTVKFGIGLLYLSLALGLLGALMLIPKIVSTQPAVPPLLLALLIVAFFGFLALFVVAADLGKNWGRIVLLVLYILLVLVNIPDIINSFGISFLDGLIRMTQMIVQSTAIVLLFIPASSEWYRSKS